jgi:phosphinothricin acetyltransferase
VILGPEGEAQDSCRPRPDRAGLSSGDCGGASGPFIIDALRPEDWEQVRAIYLEGIATGHATFETGTPSWEKWDADHLRGARLVARNGPAVLGWAALSPVSGRCVYGGVAEVSVYVAAAARSRGAGRALLEGLIRASEEDGIWTLQAGVFPENLSSLAMHRRCGFREVGRRERLGKLGGTWRDVILLERRSPTVGAG